MLCLYQSFAACCITYSKGDLFLSIVSKRGKSASLMWPKKQGVTPVFRISVEVKLNETEAPLIVTVLLEVQIRSFPVGADWWQLVVRLEGECLMRVVRLLPIMEEVGVWRISRAGLFSCCNSYLALQHCCVCVAHVGFFFSSLQMSTGCTVASCVWLSWHA